MGTTPSRYEDLSKNKFLVRFCGKETVPPNDQFWGRFLSYNLRPPVTRNDQIELDSRIDATCQQLLANNLNTGNFGSLIEVFLQRNTELLGSAQEQNIMFAWQTYNALFAVRCVLKYLLETVGEEEMIRHTEARPQTPDSPENAASRLESLFDALVEIIIDVPLSEFTYVVHLEAINCLLVLLSVQLFSQTPAEYSSIYRIAMHEEQSAHASIMVYTLLHNFVRQEHAPPGLLTQQNGGGLVLSIAGVVRKHILAGLWNVITMGMGKNSKSVQVSNNGGTAEDEERKRDTETPLASQSLLLLLVLTNHCTAVHNPYRDALYGFTDSQDDVIVTPAKTLTSFKFNFDDLYGTICKVPNTDETTLLLYMLLHRNQAVKSYIMRRADIQLLVIPILQILNHAPDNTSHHIYNYYNFFPQVIPILQILYHAPDNTSHHIYMSLIILLILSEDDTFNKNVHEIMLKGVTWYTERSISEISLGGLLVLVVIRTIQYNMLKMRDKYLHTNCLAALANMSAQFRSLHPYVSQRLLSLFETLAKKYARLESNIHMQSASSESTVVNVNGNVVNSDMIQDLTVLEEVLRMVLEIINSCLTHQLSHNPNLVYTLLYKKEIFQPFRTHSAFQDIVQNIDSVINFFSYKLEQRDQSHIGVSQVLATIQQGATQWPKDRMRKFPELKFKYVEEEQPEEFFIPYVWSVVCQGALLHWTAESIKLFSSGNGDQTTIVVC